MDIQKDLTISIEEKSKAASDEDEFVPEMTPSRPDEDDVLSEELILTPSVPDEQPKSGDLVLEAEKIFKAEEITFDGEEESEARIKEAMAAYDKAMDQAAGLKKR